MPRIRTQAQVEEFRTRLCDVAARLYFEVGYNGFNMRDLAARVGVSAMTPYRYFDDKNGILTAVRAKAFARLADRLEAAMPMGTASVVRTYVQFAMQEAAYYRLMFELIQPAAQSAEPGRPECRVREAMIDMLAEGRSRAEAEGLARCVWSALHGAICLVLAGKSNESELGDVASRQLMLVLGTEQQISAPPLQRPVPSETAVHPHMASSFPSPQNNRQQQFTRV